MPWCAACDAYRAPSAVHRDGRCRSCGGVIEGGGLAIRTDGGEHATTDEEVLPPVPWHLKLLGVALVAYLGLRAWEGVVWLFDRLG